MTLLFILPRLCDVELSHHILLPPKGASLFLDTIRKLVIIINISEHFKAGMYHGSSVKLSLTTVVAVAKNGSEKVQMY